MRCQELDSLLADTMGNNSAFSKLKGRSPQRAGKVQMYRHTKGCGTEIVVALG